MGFDFYGKTVGILGAGKIERITAKLFQAFGCRVLIYDLQPDLEWLGENDMVPGPLEEVLRKPDIVFLHLPLSLDTHHLIDEVALDVYEEEGGVFFEHLSNEILDDDGFTRP